MSPSVSVRLLLTQSDARLVAFARAGHERAFEALVQRYRRALHGYCRRLLLSDERAEDALQQAFLQAWLGLRAGTEVAEVKPWLYRIVHNAALNMLRVSGYDYCTLHESLCGADAPQADLERRIAIREALAGLAALPQMQREALLRTAVQGHPHRRVARDLGLSETALRGLVYRARASLRAAASAIVPPPLLSWALQSGCGGAPALGRLGELAGGGSAGLAGLFMKGGAVALTAGVLAGHFASLRVHRAPIDPDPTAHASVHEPHSGSLAPASLATLSGDAKVQPRPSSPALSFAPAEHRAARGGYERRMQPRRRAQATVQSPGAFTRFPAPEQSQGPRDATVGESTPSPGAGSDGGEVTQPRAGEDQRGYRTAETSATSNSRDSQPTDSSAIESSANSGETHDASAGGSFEETPSAPEFASQDPSPSEHEQSWQESTAQTGSSAPQRPDSGGGQRYQTGAQQSESGP